MMLDDAQWAPIAASQKLMEHNHGYLSCVWYARVRLGAAVLVVVAALLWARAVSASDSHVLFFLACLPSG